jgi:sucrose-6-phosphate hydrolase SacC (GH32 family)
VAVYTGCLRRPELASQGRQAQELAFSTDRGRTWTKYAHNPVLDLGLRDFRDPKVFWHQPTRRWIMTLAAKDQVSFYSSRDLKRWRHESDFGRGLGEHGGVWECPDLIDMRVVGESARRNVLLVSVNPGALARLRHRQLCRRHLVWRTGQRWSHAVPRLDEQLGLRAGCADGTVAQRHDPAARAAVDSHAAWAGTALSACGRACGPAPAQRCADHGHDRDADRTR